MSGYLSTDQVGTLLRGIKPSRVLHLDGLSHLAAYDVRAHLNRVFGFGRWSADVLDVTPLYEQTTETKNKKPAYRVGYRATVRLTVCAPDGTVLATYTECAVGDSTMPDFKRGDCHDMAIKTAESQALKRCATNLGDQFGLSLYRNGSTDPVVTVTLVGLPEPENDGDGQAVDEQVPDVVPEHQPQHEPDPPKVSAEAQALADLAPRMPTVDDLKAGVYDPAKEKHLLTAPVADPVTGEVRPLSAVIADAKTRLTQTTHQSGDAA
jgi:hypothetical protein